MQWVEINISMRTLIFGDFRGRCRHRPRNDLCPLASHWRHWWRRRRRKTAARREADRCRWRRRGVCGGASVSMVTTGRPSWTRSTSRMAARPWSCAVGGESFTGDDVSGWAGFWVGKCLNGDICAAIVATADFYLVTKKFQNFKNVKISKYQKCKQI